MNMRKSRVPVVLFMLAALLSAAGGPPSGLLPAQRAGAGVRGAALAVTPTNTNTPAGTTAQTPISQGLVVYPPVPWHDPICAGDKQRYTLTFANLTTETLTNAWLVDTLYDVCPGRCDVCQWNDNSWPYDDCSPGAIYDGKRTVRWFYPSVAPGQRITAYVEVRLWTNVAAGVFQNSITVTCDQRPAQTASSQVDVEICEDATPEPSATPTPTPTRHPEVICYDSLPEEVLIYRIDAADFRGYVTDDASQSPLIHVTSPPAPAGWNQPAFVPDSSWQAGLQVWWDQWIAPSWEPYHGATIVGLADAQGRQEGVDGTTHLIRHTFQLDAPQPEMRITSAILDMWSDNKTAWWWQGVLMPGELEGNNRQAEIFPEYIAAEGGTYQLAIQNSNDFQHSDNPQGTAFRLCVTWVPLEGLTATPTPTVTVTPSATPTFTTTAAPSATPTFTATATPQREMLPLVMMGHHE